MDTSAAKHKLQFSHNHNGKLFLDHFGFVDLHDPDKYIVGSRLDLSLRHTLLGTVSVVAVRTFQYKQISDILAYIECGKPAHYLADLLKRYCEGKIELGPETKLDHVVLHYRERHLQNHSLLLQEWWKAVVQGQPNQYATQPTFNF